MFLTEFRFRNGNLFNALIEYAIWMERGAMPCPGSYVKPAPPC